MSEWATGSDRDLGRQRIQEIRARYGLRAEKPEEKPAGHDPAECEFCLGLACFWCARAGLPIETCEHTVGGRHGAPLEPAAPVDADPEMVAVVEDLPMEVDDIPAGELICDACGRTTDMHTPDERDACIALLVDS